MEMTGLDARFVQGREALGGELTGYEGIDAHLLQEGGPLARSEPHVRHVAAACDDAALRGVTGKARAGGRSRGYIESVASDSDLHAIFPSPEILRLQYPNNPPLNVEYGKRRVSSRRAARTLNGSPARGRNGPLWFGCHRHVPAMSACARLRRGRPRSALSTMAMLATKGDQGRPLRKTYDVDALSRGACRRCAWRRRRRDGRDRGGSRSTYAARRLPPRNPSSRGCRPWALWISEPP